MRLAGFAVVLAGVLGTATAVPLDRRADSTAGLPDATVQLIKAVLSQTANQSWEIGTHLQALTEYDYPPFSPFDSSFMPPPSTPTPTSVMDIAAGVVRAKAPNALQLMPDGSAADPASCGPAIAMSNATGQTVDGVTPAMFATAASGQLDYLLTQVPKTSDGALSHRNDQVQLWSDFVYMVPPFLAYYGVMTMNESLVEMSYDQIRLYRQYLRRPNGLWAHIVLGSMSDPGLWATGNGWAAAGIMRVYATIENSAYKSQFASQLNDLGSWSAEIVASAFPLLTADGLFHNYLNESDTFTDAASTALLTSVSYRLAQMSISSATVQQAEQARTGLYKRINRSTGVLSPVVDPMSFKQEGTLSPEGEAFVLLMEASWKDWKQQGGSSGGQSASSSTRMTSTTAALASMVLLVMVALL